MSIRAIAGARQPRWDIWLLDSHDRPKRRLPTVRDGQINLSATDRLGGDASLTITEAASGDIDWMRDRVRITYNPGVPGWQPWDLGVYLLASPTYRRRVVSSWEVTLQTKMVVLDEATTEGAWVLRKDHNLVDAAAGLIRATGETRIAVTPSTARAASDIIFPAGESILTVVNTLLEAANYWAAHTDGLGQYLLVPYQPPMQRPIAWEFLAGEMALHAPDWDRTHDQSSVPNRVETFTAGTDEEDPIVGVATNNNPDSPYSWQARGRWITRREQVEAASQTEADALAARYLLAAMSPLAKLSVSHAMVPIRPRQAVRFVSRGHEARATVQKMTIPLGFDAQVSAEWNEVTDP